MQCAFPRFHSILLTNSYYSHGSSASVTFTLVLRNGYDFHQNSMRDTVRDVCSVSDRSEYAL